MTNTVYIDITADNTNFKNKVQESVLFARDNGKKLDNALLAKLDLNIAEFQLKIQNAKDLLKKAKQDGDYDLQVKANIDLNGLGRELTEAKRQMNNYLNTGENGVSRLQNKFNQVTDEIKQTRKELLEIGKDTKGIDTLLKKADDLYGSFNKGVINSKQLSEGLNNIGKEAKTLEPTLGNLINTLGGLALYENFKASLMEKIQLGINFEDSFVSFKVLLKSGEEAKKMLQDLNEFAKNTPFEIQGIRESAKSLLAFNIAKDDIIPTLQRLGDVAGLVGTPLSQIVRVYGQIKTANQLFAGDLNQLTEAGVPIISQLAKQFGSTEAEIKKMTENGKIHFKDIERAFIELTSAGGLFYNGMAEKSKTLSGLWSSFKDTITLAGEAIGNKLIPYLKPIVEWMTAFVTNYPALSISILGLTTVLLGLGAGALLITPAIVTLNGLLVSFGVTLGSILLPITLTIAGLSALYIAYNKNFLGIGDLLDSVFKKVSIGFNLMLKGLEIVYEKIESVFSFLYILFTKLYKNVSGIFEGLSQIVNGFINIFSSNFEVGLNEVGRGFLILLKNILGIFNNLGSGVLKVTLFMGKTFFNTILGIATLFSELGDNIIKILVNIGKNIGNFVFNVEQALSNIDWANALNGFLLTFNKILDNATSGVKEWGSNVASYLKELLTGNFDASFSGGVNIKTLAKQTGGANEKGYVNITDGVNFEKTKAVFSNIAKDFELTFPKVINETIKLNTNNIKPLVLDQVLPKTNLQNTNKTTGGGSKGGGVKEDKNISEELKKEIEYNNAIKKERQKLLEENKKKAKEEKENKAKLLEEGKEDLKKYYSFVSDELNKSSEKIKDFNEKIKASNETIKNLQKELENLGSEKLNKLGERYVEIQKEILELSKDEETNKLKLNELNKEKTQIEDNATKEELDKIKKELEKTQTQKILDEFAKKELEQKDKIKIEEEKIKEILRNKILEEEIYKNLDNSKKSLETNFTNFLFEEQVKRISLLEEMKIKALEVAKVLNAVGIKSSNEVDSLKNNNNNINNVINNTFNQNINSAVDVNKVNKITIESMEANQKGMSNLKL